MKKTLLALLLAGATTAAFGQGAVVWGNNLGGNIIPVYGPDPANPLLALTGQSALGKPVGTTVYGGPLLSGTGYTFQFWAGSSSANLALIVGASTTFRTGTGALPNGLVNGGTVTIPGVEPGVAGFYQIHVWDNKGGTLSDWASAQAAGTGMGSSAILSTGLTGGVDPVTGNPVATPFANTWVSFNITAIPEPATFALAGLGAAALLIFRRRK